MQVGASRCRWVMLGAGGCRRVLVDAGGCWSLPVDAGEFCWVPNFDSKSQLKF